MVHLSVRQGKRPSDWWLKPTDAFVDHNCL
jgi:hypothetical protein